MVTRITMEPVSPGFSSRLDLRHRSLERAHAPGLGKANLRSEDGDARAASAEESSDDADTAQQDRTADFAAAVIAATLPSTPQTAGELIRRIGYESSEQSQARLRDLLI